MTDGGGTGGRVVVVGSVNVDRTIRCASLPRPGETTLAHGVSTGFGGKGANQAAAAAHLDAQTWMVGAVGDGADGSAALADLQGWGVHTEHVRALADTDTGVAYVLVDDEGDNSIVVVPGANAALRAADVEAALGDLVLGADDVVLACAEIPEECVAAAAGACARSGARLVYNLAPARPLAETIASRLAVLVVNEVEARQVAAAGDVDDGTDGPAELSAALDALAGRVTAIVCTRGAAGALLRVGGQHLDVPAGRAEVIDTTGAGDAFCGALAADLAAGRELAAAVATAVAAGGIAVTGVGARGALAGRADLGRATSSGA